MDVLDHVDVAVHPHTDWLVYIMTFCPSKPTMFMDDAMYFGQDRLDFIEEALGN